MRLRWLTCGLAIPTRYIAGTMRYPHCGSVFAAITVWAKAASDQSETRPQATLKMESR